jgi:peptidoglycan/xylan/chitin deacetylase (PgdA/CDA1 family)
MAQPPRHAACSNVKRTVIKRVLSRVADASGVLDWWLRAAAPPDRAWLPVLTYHRIHPEPEAQPFDRGVIDATPRELATQLEEVRRHFTPIGASDLVRYVEEDEPLPPRPVLVTFDDGYRECVTRAVPILKHFRVKATFFVSTAFVGERRVFWWDRMSYVLRNARERTLRLSFPETLGLELDADPEPQLRRLLDVVKSSYDLDFERFLDELAQSADVGWTRDDEVRHADELVMTWDDVRALRDAGMEVCSHTRTHRILQNVVPEELNDELAGSRADLERELATEVRAVSYPVGRPIARFPHVVDRVASAGYALGFSSGLGDSPSRCHPLDIGRILMDRGMDPSRFRALLAHPYFGSA